MRTGFLRSKEFWIAATIGLLVVAGAAFAFSLSVNPEVRTQGTSCAPATAGFAPIASAEDSGVRSEGWRVVRTVSFTVNASAVGNGSADLCTAYGDVQVQPSADGQARVVFRIDGSPGARDAIAATQVEAVARAADGRLDLVAWQASHASVRQFFDEEGVGVDIVLELPDTATWGLRVDTRYGDVSVVRLPVSGVLDTRYGDVEVLDVDLRGALEIDTSYGDVEASFVSVGSGRLTVDSRYGDLRVRLPRQADAGYDVLAQTSHGDADVSIGATERFDKDQDGDTVNARSEGYAAKAAQLEVRAMTNYGDVSVALR